MCRFRRRLTLPSPPTLPPAGRRRFTAATCITTARVAQSPTISTRVIMYDDIIIYASIIIMTTVHVRIITTISPTESYNDRQQFFSCFSSDFSACENFTKRTVAIANGILSLLLSNRAYLTIGQTHRFWSCNCNKTIIYYRHVYLRTRRLIV